MATFMSITSHFHFFLPSINLFENNSIIVHCILLKGKIFLRCSAQTLSQEREQKRTLRAENEDWDKSLVPKLKAFALDSLVKRWCNNPILDELPNPVDRDSLLELLPTDIPFELIIQKIPHEYYWSRAAKDRWEHNNPNDHGNSWKRLYCERHLNEFLESFENSESDYKECESLLQLVRDCIFTVTIRSLRPSKILPQNWFEAGEEDNDQCAADLPVHHIPLDYIIKKLPEIREIRLHFGMIYMNDGFEWRDFEFSIEDCLNLGKGIKDAKKMERISITRSNLDQPRVAALLQGIAVNNNIRVLNLSHCKLANAGASAIGEFLKLHRCLEELYLTNNNIEAQGVAGIVHGLLQERATPLKHLDLRLNPLRDEGGTHIGALLLRIQTLEKLNVSGCCLKTASAISLAEVISSGYMKMPFLELDISNNNLGPIAGEAFDVAVKSCLQITGLDVRMCNFLKESEYFISESISRNREDMMRNKMKPQIPRDSKPSVIMRANSLLPPPGFEDLQKFQREIIADVEVSTEDDALSAPKEMASDG